MLTYTGREGMNRTLIRREYDIVSISTVQVSWWHKIPNFSSNEVNLVYNQVSGVYLWVQWGEYSQSQYTMNSSLFFIMSANINCHL